MQSYSVLKKLSEVVMSYLDFLYPHRQLSQLNVPAQHLK